MAANVEEADDGSTPEYTVFYHAGFSGRAQAADLMLVDAQRPWQRRGKTEMKQISSSVFALPAVYSHASGTMLGQTTAQAAWLGQEVGYAPPPGLEFIALKIACDIADIWSESYKKRKELKLSPEAADHSNEWLHGRFGGYIKAIEASRCEAAAMKIDQDIETWTYLLGPTPCYVDFLLANAYLVQVFMFSKNLVDTAAGRTECTGVIGAYSALLERPLIQAYLSAAEPVLYNSVSAAKLGLE